MEELRALPLESEPTRVERLFPWTNGEYRPAPGADSALTTDAAPRAYDREDQDAIGERTNPDPNDANA